MAPPFCKKKSRNERPLKVTEKIICICFLPLAKIRDPLLCWWANVIEIYLFKLRKMLYIRPHFVQI